MIPSSIDSIIATGKRRLITHLIRAARKKPRIFKAVRVIRRNRHGLKFICCLLAFDLFTLFIAWDIQNLQHDEPVKKTIREDSAAALADAIEELARMIKEERDCCG